MVTRDHGGLLLLAFLSSLWSDSFSIQPRPTVPGIGPPSEIWALPYNHQLRKCTTDLLTGQSGGGIFLIVFQT